MLCRLSLELCCSQNYFNEKRDSLGSVRHAPSARFLSVPLLALRPAYYMPVRSRELPDGGIVILLLAKDGSDSSPQPMNINTHVIALKVGAMDIERAKLALSAAARLHAAFWPNPLQLPRRPGTPSIGSTPPASTPQPLSSPHISSNAAAHRSGHEEQSDHGRGEKCRTEDTKGCDRSRRFPRGLHEQGTFWSLEKRDPADLQGLVQEYENLLKRFRPVLPDSWFLARQTEDTASVSASDIVGRPDQGDVDSVGGNECRTLYPEKGPQTLGRRIAARARELDAAAHGGISGVVGNNRGGDMRAGGEAVRQRSTRGMTLVHGDLKTWNVFFKIREPSIALLQESPTPVPGANADAVANSETSSREEQVKFIDWQVRSDTL